VVPAVAGSNPVAHPQGKCCKSATRGRIEACDPPQRLLVTNRETDESYVRGKGVPPYDEAIEATLTADGDQTILVIEVRGMPLDKIAFLRDGLANPRRRSRRLPRWA
jgi:hypothetical protein